MVFILHEASLAQFGGSSGLRDAGLLESALARPVNLFTYGKPTLHDLSASYAFGLIKNHPFIDDNKRASRLVAMAFIELNGVRVVAPMPLLLFPRHFPFVPNIRFFLGACRPSRLSGALRAAVMAACPLRLSTSSSSVMN